MSYREKSKIKNRYKAFLADILSIFAMLAALAGIWIGAANIQYYPVRSTAAILIGFYLLGKIFVERDILEENDD